MELSVEYHQQRRLIEVRDEYTQFVLLSFVALYLAGYIDIDGPSAIFVCCVRA